MKKLKKRNYLHQLSKLNTLGELKLIFEYLPIAILVEDCSVFAQVVNNLKDQNVQDIRRYLIRNPDIVIRAFRDLKIIYANKAALSLYQARSKGQLVSYFYRSLGKNSVDSLVDELMAFVSVQKEYEAEFKFKDIRGKSSDVLLRFSIPKGFERSLTRVIVGLQDITLLKKREQQLRKLAQIDGLTGLLNHHALSRRLEEELVRAKRYELNLSVMMIDVDYFKKINDEFGHQKGDQVIKYAAKLIRDCMRKSDIVGRYGGDEFFVILPETKARNAKIAAERIQKTFLNSMFKYQKNDPIKNTLSIGISGYPFKETADSKDLIAQADRAMYRAKETGRDRIVLA